MFLDLATLEPHENQWTYLSGLGRLTPREVTRLAHRLGEVTVGAGVDRLRSPTSTKIAAQPPAVVRARLGATITIHRSDHPPLGRGQLARIRLLRQPLPLLGTTAAPAGPIGGPTQAVITIVERERRSAGS
ncbi:hypothetical protein SAMN05661080_03879 [Modestobacter sp. DSM 44400]|nr:hypothetical protein [Modestobacter sp. DSM 44400]SDY56598.1 hypothetical protein SAMN05661080_03879 [Modestobacter sp. DSM 44400]